ncbi:MAG: M48 family metalloprotease [Ignavibacteriaceae bacterium]|nr:M48 family metalloprotease [Ignavibacteriaceae bacterium]
MKFSRSIYLLIIIASPFFYNSCDSNINIFSKSDDVQLGLDISNQIKGDPQQYPIYHGDASVKSYINSRIFQSILASPQIASKNIYNYQLEIIDDDGVLNAFALPGGYIYVYTGLLKYLNSEASLAGILGHEIAHAELRHSTQRLTAQYGVSILLNLVLGENPSQVAEIASNLFVGFAFLANSRSDESEADRTSFSYLKDTRYYQGGVKFFFEKMRADNLVSIAPSAIETFLSTHPNPIDRISEVNTLLQQGNIEIKDYTATGNGIFNDEYTTNIKNKIR